MEKESEKANKHKNKHLLFLAMTQAQVTEPKRTGAVHCFQRLLWFGVKTVMCQCHEKHRIGLVCIFFLLATSLKLTALHPSHQAKKK